MKSLFKLPVFCIVLLISCAKNDVLENNAPSGSGWLVPTENLVINEGVHDKIQSIDNPIFIKPSNVSMTADEEVFIFQVQDKIRIYPVSVLWHHEIVNDRYGDNLFTVSFCPLTGSGLAWGRQLSDTPNSYGVSGHLYNSNLVAYDRFTESYWSQMTLQSIKGALGGSELSPEYLLRTTYATAIEAFPDASILFDSIFNSLCDSICIPPEQTFSNSFPADSYFGLVFRDEALLFDYQLFTDSTQLIRGSYKGNSFVVVGSKERSFVTAFLVPETLSLEPLYHQFPDIMIDSEGNKYDIMGYISSGTQKGQRLKSPLFYSAKRFAWSPFFDVAYF